MFSQEVTMRQSYLPALLYMAALLACGPPPRALQSITRADLDAFSAALKRFRAEGGPYPVTGSTFASFYDVIGNRLVEGEYLRDTAREPWGGTFGYWSDGTHFIIASSGPNRRFDLEYGQVAQEPVMIQPEMLCAQMSESNDDYVVMDGIPCPQDI